MFLASRSEMIFALHASASIPSYSPEFTMTPWPEYGSPDFSSSPSARAITRLIGISNFSANSKSRSSCRDGHDGAGPVADEHVVGYPNRYFLAVHGVDAITTCKDPDLSLARSVRRDHSSWLRPPTPLLLVPSAQPRACRARGVREPQP